MADFKLVRFMFEAGTKLKLSTLPLSTAITLLHQFCRDYNLEDYDEYMVAAAFLYIGGKAEEEHLRLRDIINVVYRICNGSDSELEIDTTYWALRESMSQTELFLLRALQFKINVQHPHKYLVHYLKSLYDWLDHETTTNIPIARTAWSLLNDSYHISKIILQTRPHKHALACLYLSVNIFGVEVNCAAKRESDSEGCEEEAEAKDYWCKAFIEDISIKELKKIGTEILQSYELETKLYS